MKIVFMHWEISEVEPLEYEDEGNFVEFIEEVKPYQGICKDETRVVFVDGVRRTELACYIEDEEKNYGEGIFTSIGVGGLSIKLGSINLLSQSLFSPRVERFLVVNGNLRLPERVSVQGLNFKLRYSDGIEPTLKVNEIMREELESDVAKKAYKELNVDLVICDGPLSYSLKNTECVGYIKNIKKLYIRQDDLYIIKNLKKGQRTPIIKVRSTTSAVNKYTWYVKLEDEGDITSVARLEAFSSVDEERVIRLANLTAGILPKFSSKPFTDRRAPQNLAPIKNLEDTLRCYLGHYSIVRHKILRFFNV